MTTHVGIPGCTYSTETVARSPLSREDFELLKKTGMFAEEDEHALHQVGEVLQDQIEE